MPNQKKKRGIESHITVRAAPLWLSICSWCAIMPRRVAKKKLVTKSLQIGSSALHWILWFWFNGLLYPTNRSPCLIISFTNYSILCLFFSVYFYFILPKHSSLWDFWRVWFLCVCKSRKCVHLISPVFFTLGRIFFRRHQFKGATVYLTI